VVHSGKGFFTKKGQGRFLWQYPWKIVAVFNVLGQIVQCWSWQRDAHQFEGI